MRVSTKGQYGIKLMLDLAVHNTGEFITIKSIAKRQDMSEKYLEQIISVMSRVNFVQSARGAKGGYKLAKKPEEYTVGMILRAIDGSLAPVDGIDDGGYRLETPEDKSLHEMWLKLNDAINSVVDSVTLEDLVKGYQDNVGYEYFI